MVGVLYYNIFFKFKPAYLVHEANTAFEAKRKEKVDEEIGRVRELTTGNAFK